jgi:hypothetical protein
VQQKVKSSSTVAATSSKRSYKDDQNIAGDDNDDNSNEGSENASDSEEGGEDDDEGDRDPDDGGSGDASWVDEEVNKGVASDGNGETLLVVVSFTVVTNL